MNTNRRCLKEKDLLIIFTRNPELGKCKTRLAAHIGDSAALEIYKFLLDHTVKITRSLEVDKRVYYSEEIWENDIWDRSIYQKSLQRGSGLGERMQNAFEEGFQRGYQKIIIIGSDLYDLETAELQEAFAALNKADFVLGPASDGGYYLLGMTRPYPRLFKEKAWGTHTVLEKTLEDLEGESLFLLDEKNDIDVFEDIKGHPDFKPFLKPDK